MKPIPPPPAVAGLVEAMGIEATLKLLEAFAGERIYVPQTAAAGQVIAEAIGLEAATGLSKAYGRGYLKVPMAREWRVLIYQSRGLSYRAIARRTKCTEGNVSRILTDQGATQSQLNLFDG